MHLNPVDVDADWYLRRLSTAGDALWCSKRLAVFYVLCVVLLVTLEELEVLSMAAFSGLSGLLSIAPLMIMLVLSCKMYRFEDGFHIIGELKLIAAITCVSTFAYLFFGIALPRALGFDFYITITSASGVSVLQSLIYLYVQTLYVLRVIRNDENLHFRVSLGEASGHSDERIIAETIANASARYVCGLLICQITVVC